MFPICRVTARGESNTPAKRVLKLDPHSPSIERLVALTEESDASEQLSEFSWFRLYQACSVEGEQLTNPPAFSRDVATLWERGFAVA